MRLSVAQISTMGGGKAGAASGGSTKPGPPLPVPDDPADPGAPAAPPPFSPPVMSMGFPQARAGARAAAQTRDISLAEQLEPIMGADGPACYATPVDPRAVRARK